MKLANTLLATAAITVLGTAAIAAEGSAKTEHPHNAPHEQLQTEMESQGSLAAPTAREGDAAAGVTAGAKTSPAAESSSQGHKQAARPDVTMDIETIQSVQASLKNEGHAVSVDGVWGPKTAQALRDFQRDNSLPATGTLNAETLAALNLR